MTNNNSANPMNSKVEGKALILERIFNAPRELVFKAFSEAEHLKRWYGPKGYTLDVCHVDLRPGGSWHYCMKKVDEKPGDRRMWSKSVYHEIIVPEKIVQTTEYLSDEDGNILEGMPEGIVTFTFQELEGKTKVISHTEYKTPEAVKMVMDMCMVDGYTQAWDKLEEQLLENA
jgi:uncharacterized protein YndB with AHSA1/START domain